MYPSNENAVLDKQSKRTGTQFLFFGGMWWLIGCAPYFWGRGPGFEFGISHNDPDALQDHCEEWETYP